MTSVNVTELRQHLPDYLKLHEIEILTSQKQFKAIPQRYFALDGR